MKLAWLDRQVIDPMNAEQVDLLARILEHQRGAGRVGGSPERTQFHLFPDPRFGGGSSALDNVTPHFRGALPEVPTSAHPDNGLPCIFLNL